MRGFRYLLVVLAAVAGLALATRLVYLTHEERTASAATPELTHQLSAPKADPAPAPATTTTATAPAPNAPSASAVRTEPTSAPVQRAPATRRGSTQQQPKQQDALPVSQPA